MEELIGDIVAGIIAILAICIVIFVTAYAVYKGTR